MPVSLNWTPEDLGKHQCEQGHEEQGRSLPLDDKGIEFTPNPKGIADSLSSGQ
jgi:hypothetical protein